jgi:Cu-Zn family superoxide dismutase
MRSLLAAAAAVFVATTSFAAPVTKAVAAIQPGKDQTVSGTVTFAKTDTGVHVTAKLTGLPPGTHGFHIHEFGDCSAADFSSAGGHFNPAGKSHASPKDTEHHEGDLGNIEAGKDGSATLDYVEAGLSFEGAGSILGRGVIVHVNPDDFKTQPTGNAGGRAGCGVIGAAKGE